MKTPIDIRNLQKVSVQQLDNKNQFVITYSYKDKETNEFERVVCFQSYRTLIAIYYPYKNRLYINLHYWDYSKTTSKHLKMFINEYTSFTYESRLQWLKEVENNNNLFWFVDND